MFAHRHSDGKEQFDRALPILRHHEAVIALGRDGRGAERCTTRSMMSAEEALVRAAGRLANARQHAVSMNDMGRAVAAAEARGLRLSGEQRNALEHVIRRPRLSLVVGLAGTGKSAMLGVAPAAWAAAGYPLSGAALTWRPAKTHEEGA